MKWGDIIMQVLINFSKANQDVLPYLKKQHNMSAYVVSLIRADMKREQNKQEQILTKEQVIELIKDTLKSSDLKISDTKNIFEEFPLNAVFGIMDMEN